ncbi:MAG: hypothetical protein GY948_00910 [Alphaproteobacteria bacterium]|nr:hypothetical protein [Alphaproteobacteria bacterium]
MRTLSVASALLFATSASVFAAEQNKPLNIDPLSSVSETQPQRVAWENKSDSLSIVPVTAEPLKNNFAAEKTDPENTKR